MWTNNATLATTATHMENENQEEVIVSTSETTEQEAEETSEQDPLKTELDKVKSSGKTEAEKAQFSLKKNADKVRELGGDPAEILGIKPVERGESDDDRPLTVGEYKKIQASQNAKTALQLADEIPDQSERELAKYYLENRIVPSGNPQEDLRDARRMVNSVKNEQIIAEQNRKNPAKNHSSGSSAPLKQIQKEAELTPVEIQYMKPPFNLTKEQIIKARKG